MATGSFFGALTGGNDASLGLFPGVGNVVIAVSEPQSLAMLVSGMPDLVARRQRAASRGVSR